MKISKLQFLTVIALALVMFILPCTCKGDVYRQVPVVINILSNSGASVVNATSVVAEVNEYFRTNNWNVRFKVERVNENVTMGDSGDGDLTVAEGDTVVARGLLPTHPRWAALRRGGQFTETRPSLSKIEGRTVLQRRQSFMSSDI